MVSAGLVNSLEAPHELSVSGWTFREKTTREILIKFKVALFYVCECIITLFKSTSFGV